MSVITRCKVNQVPVLLCAAWQQARLPCAACCLQICVVGGGAGGVEISLALNHRLKAERQEAGKQEAAKCSVSLFSKGNILAGHTPAARRKLLRLAMVCFYTGLCHCLF